MHIEYIYVCMYKLMTVKSLARNVRNENANCEKLVLDISYGEPRKARGIPSMEGLRGEALQSLHRVHLQLFLIIVVVVVGIAFS